MKRYRIRKLTERECFKLQGFTQTDAEKCKSVGVSKTQLLKQCGNAIAVDCIQLIWEHVYKAQYDPEYETFDEMFTSEVS